MISIHLTNSLTRKKELFIPIDEQHVRMYVCGPTVYDRPHIGNARAAVVYDLLFRLLKKFYNNVTYVRNITDVDDKIIAATKNSNESISELTQRITKLYNEDMHALFCLPPTIEPKATEHIQEMIQMIESLISKGHAYFEAEHVLFDINSFNKYGTLSQRNLDEMIAGARVEVAPYKKHPADFVLWKPAKLGEEQASFSSPWGKGRPGWHIECSAMSKKHLGETFDIHGGGADLIFPHHENELAQSSCANDHKQFARYWVHNGFLTIDGAKMSKSLGNFKTPSELFDIGICGATLRYFYFTAHYHKPLDYTQKAISDSHKAIERFRNALNLFELNSYNVQTAAEENIEPKILSAIADDLNTPLALSHLHNLADLCFSTKDIVYAKALYSSMNFLGIDLLKKNDEIPKQIRDLAEKRKIAKSEKKWALADQLRDELLELGYTVKDTQGGYELNKQVYSPSVKS